MPYWKVPKDLWKDCTVAVLASGSGMNNEVTKTVQMAGIPAIAINNTFRLAPWADMLYAADKEWWLHDENKEAFKFNGLKVSASDVSQVNILKVTGKFGYDPDPSSIRTGGNSAYQATHIAMQAGAKKILLCGVNMTGPNWHKRHAQGLRDTDEVHYKLYRDWFESLVLPAFYLGVDIVNVTPHSALKCFRASTLKDEL